MHIRQLYLQYQFDDLHGNKTVAPSGTSFECGLQTNIKLLYHKHSLKIKIYKFHIKHHNVTTFWLQSSVVIINTYRSFNK